MLKTAAHKLPTTILIGFILSVFFALAFVSTANAQTIPDTVGSNLSSEQKEQIKQRIEEARARINEMREKSKDAINELSDQQKLEVEELRTKNKEQLEELRRQAEERIKELREKAGQPTDDDDEDSLNSGPGNTISEAAREMRSGERTALFDAIIERLQTIDAERGDNSPLLKLAIEQLQKLRSQVAEDEEEDVDSVESDEDEDEDEDVDSVESDEDEDEDEDDGN